MITLMAKVITAKIIIIIKSTRPPSYVLCAMLPVPRFWKIAINEARKTTPVAPANCCVMLKIDETSAVFCVGTWTEAFEMVLEKVKLKPVRSTRKNSINKNGVN